MPMELCLDFFSLIICVCSITVTCYCFIVLTISVGGVCDENGGGEEVISERGKDKS